MNSTFAAAIRRTDLERGELVNYRLAHGCPRGTVPELKRIPEAPISYEKALSLVR
jgi:hypothetical protein